MDAKGGYLSFLRNDRNRGRSRTHTAAPTAGKPQASRLRSDTDSLRAVGSALRYKKTDKHASRMRSDKAIFDILTQLY